MAVVDGVPCAEVPTNLGVDVVGVLVAFPEVDCWEEKLSVGVERGFGAIRSGIKTSRVAKRKLVSRRNRMAVLFF
jgi:hypothetical protein